MYNIAILSNTIFIKVRCMFMGFRVEREEYINKTFRLDTKLVKEMESICDKKNISLNRLVVLCIQYALENLEEQP